MTNQEIERAIEILDKEYEDTFMGTEREWKEAVRLGSKALTNERELVEALKRIMACWALFGAPTDWKESLQAGQEALAKAEGEK